MDKSRSNVIVVLLLGLLSIMIPTPAPAQVNAEQVTAIGRNVLSMEDYLLAIQYFNQAIKAKPYLAEPYFLRALAKLQLEDYQGAEIDCDMAIARNKYKTEAYKLRGFARQQLGKDSLAVIDYDTGLEYNPTDREFLFYKALAETELHRYDNAEKTLSRLIDSNPGFYEGLTARAHLSMMRGDTVRALEDIDKSLKISKTQLNPYLMKAEIYSERQDWPEAIEAMDAVIRLNPERPELYNNRAFMRYRNDDYYGAMADYNSAIEIDPFYSAALFNRGLLKFEVYALEDAASDFTKVLDLDNNNFHALYNRALVYLNLKEYEKAEPDVKAIIGRYPRFYPAYYVMAEIREGRGDMRGAVRNVKMAEDLIDKYVKDPVKNSLDRPTIDVQANKGSSEEESEEEVMDKFNRLVAGVDLQETAAAFNDRIKGKVQNRDASLQPEPIYGLSLTPPEKSLRAMSNYFKELADFNSKNYVSDKIYFTTDGSQAEENEINRIFEVADRYTSVISQGKGRPADYLLRGVAYAMLRNYDAAVKDFDKAMEMMPGFTVALMGEAYAKAQKGLAVRDEVSAASLQEALAAYDKALALNPLLVYAWYNKGIIYYELKNYAEAEACFSEAVKMDPELGQAYYNRGLSRLALGRKQAAFNDFSKAGELGVVQSYRIMKKMN